MSEAAGRQVWLSGWGHSTGSIATLRDVDDVPGLRELCGGRARGGLLARGLGRSYGDAAQNAGGDVLAPWRPAAPIRVDPAAATATFSAGTSIARALRELLPRGWMLPVVPGTSHVTIGGAIAADVHGKNHHADGSFGRWVTGLTLADGAGDVHRLSPECDAGAFWATLGGMGLTGVVLDATVRLVPVSTGYMQVRTRRYGDLDAVFDAMTSSSARYHVAWVDGHAGASFGRAVLDEAEHAEADELPGRLGSSPRHYRPRRLGAVPPLPVRLLRPALLRAFNGAWWHKAPHDRFHLATIDTFFHPLDVLGGWHRLYGPAGLLQWQCVVPLDARDVITSALRRLAPVPPYLVVLKRFGTPTPGPLSFPAPGWTVAVDLPADSPSVRPLLDRLDAEVVAAGGRVYLAKDARMSSSTFAAMYPRLEEWQEVRARLDPRRVFRSDLGRRLGIA